MADMLKPPLTLLVKLGSIAVHTAEMLSPHAHGFDRIATEQLLCDHEVMEWIEQMADAAMLPLKRNAKGATCAESDRR